MKKSIPKEEWNKFTQEGGADDLLKEESARKVISELMEDVTATKETLDALKGKLKDSELYQQMQKEEANLKDYRRKLFSAVEESAHKDPDKYQKTSFMLRGVRAVVSAPQISLDELKVSAEDLAPFREIFVDGHCCVRPRLDMQVVEEAIAQGIMPKEVFLDAGVVAENQRRTGYVSIKKR